MPESPELAAEAQAIPATFPPAVAGAAPPLAGMRDLAYLIQKETSLVRAFESPFFSVRGASERAFFMAEEFT